MVAGEEEEEEEEETAVKARTTESASYPGNFVVFIEVLIEMRCLRVNQQEKQSQNLRACTAGDCSLAAEALARTRH